MDQPHNMKPGKHLTIVIKIGTSSIVDETTHEPILSILSLIVETAIKLRRDGHRVVIVSSGAVGVGLQRMNIPKRPKHLAQIQALAAIGQSRLMSIWDSLFAHMNQPVAQILITRNDIADRSQYLNAQNTLAEVLSLGVIPIVNENDTLAVSEIKFGDNDTLSAIAAAMVHADYLFLMTDVDCLYDKNPRKFPDAKPILVVDDIDALQADVSSAGSALGTGGMATKIVAARLATAAGTSTIITKSSKPGNIAAVIRHLHPPTNSSPTTTTQSESLPPLHTRFVPSSTPIGNRAFWILHGLAPHGTVYIDRGASNALANKAGLLPVGVVGVEGSFAQQEAVRLVVVDKQPLGSLQSATVDSGSSAEGGAGGPVLQLVSRGEEIGRAVVNYSSAEISRIKGLRSSDIAKVLGYADSEYVAFRENVSLHAIPDKSRPATPSALNTPNKDRTPESSLADLRSAH
ncbi:Glutamate 5-kinase, variant 2 [Exophiala dermatitidis]|uniref:Glutamate 5-kinase n=3 Tax=Exophiala dermatitidis TaxID=5970 RepID=H6BTZ9_EXODN|nr:glutamate 5-kinase [Exophiala dermatitidis NIH/UT8656]KAJ4539221.1 Glutamate 5-kinase [Exophiala dermatitidis]EHY55576.1 glutamate 5-kinase [Exophiala dermatitidis NIH/UT8656]KAJ4540498.1 Glutamate 5-kinase, variant 2 [Exophiala dermatitidis]KAJ4564670.1 Glutamate 5-kinase, variant 2 [Exophiala dermatitidis]KAJ4573118.1 Glutamate 5-kinase [Exophiala dermatitidis]